MHLEISYVSICCYKNDTDYVDDKSSHFMNMLQVQSYFPKNQQTI